MLEYLTIDTSEIKADERAYTLTTAYPLVVTQTNGSKITYGFLRPLV